MKCLLDNRLAPLTFTWGFLEEYGRALGIDVFNEAFYGGDGYATHAYPWFLPRLPSISLAEAREQLGLD